MNRETLKSIILVILIAFSLVLTVALWSYQPASETLEEGGSTADNKLTGVGTEEELSDLLIPEMVVYHENSDHFTFPEPNGKTNFNDQFKKWALSNFDTTPGEVDLNNIDKGVEVIFPTSLPLKVIKDLFTVNNNVILDNFNKNFERVFLIQNDERSTSTYELWFIQTSSQGDEVTLKASVNASAGDRAIKEFEERNDLTEIVRLADEMPSTDVSNVGANHIYLPTDDIFVPQVVLQTTAVPVTPLQNDLFPSPSSTIFYEAGEGIKRTKTNDRRLDQKKDDRLMEFLFLTTKSINESGMTEYDLLTRSVQDINSHLGWTNEFRIESLSTGLDELKYRMYFNEFPVMENEETEGFAQISLTYEDSDIQSYDRPLIKFVRTPYETDSMAELQSVDEVINQIQNSNTYDFNSIKNIGIRYTLEEQTNNLAYNLIPEWYIETESENWAPLFKEEPMPNGNAAP